MEKSEDQPIISRKRAIAYLRPGLWGDNPQSQKQFIEWYCEENNIELTKEPFCDEAEYITQLPVYESPGLNDALDYCKDKKNKVDTLIIINRDRLGNSTAEYLRCKIDFHNEGVEIVSATNIQSIDDDMETICVMIVEHLFGKLV